MAQTVDAEPLLAVRGLAKRFGELRAVDGVDLDIVRGGVTAVIGPNGAGKTTLFNLVTRRLLADTGTVTFRGRDITRTPAHEIARMGLARSFQISSVFPDLSVRDNVLVAVLIDRKRSGVALRQVEHEDAAQQRTDELLADLGLTDFARLPCRQLAYGDRRRVEVGMVLALEPELVLLDEPTAGMGPAERHDITRLIDELVASGRYTVVLTEHDVDLVFNLAERVVVMHQGRIIADGHPDDIEQDPDVRRAYLGGAT